MPKKVTRRHQKRRRAGTIEDAIALFAVPCPLDDHKFYEADFRQPIMPGLRVFVRFLDNCSVWHSSCQLKPSQKVKNSK